MMQFKDILLALCVVTIWGVNFVIIKVGLSGMPPLLLAGCRFLFVFFPACFFILRPKISIKWLCIYGLTMSFGQFALLFLALSSGMPSGVASLILQSQAFFTIILGGIFFSEKPKATQIIGITIAAVGMFILAEGGMMSEHGSIPLFAFILTLCAGLSWACANISNKVIIKTSAPFSVFGLLIWSSLLPAVLFFISSALFEDHTLIVESVIHPHQATLFSLVYLVIMATMVGFGIWATLLSRYPMYYVAPFSLLVPVIGLISGNIFYEEQLSALQIGGALCVMAGLFMNVFGAKLIQMMVRTH